MSSSGAVGTANLADSAVTTAKIAADAITGAKIADDAVDVEHLNAGTATSGQVLTATSSGFDWLDASSGWTLGTAQSPTSGTQVNFTSIPAGIRVIHVMFAGLSSSSTTSFRMQIGDSGGIESNNHRSGVFDSAAQYNSNGAYWFLNEGTVRSTSNSGLHGTVILSNLTGNTWTITGTTMSVGAASWAASGSKTLSGVLDRIRVSISAGTFNSGTINIMYQ